MKKILLVIFYSASLAAGAQSFIHTKDNRIVDGDGNKIILRGAGLGGWMLQEGYMLRVHGIGQQQHVIRGALETLAGKEATDQFYTEWLTNNVRKSDIDSLAKWGFNSVRLPMHYNLFTLPVEKEKIPGDNTWIEKGFQLTDQLLAWCKENKLYLILDLHAAPGGQGNDLNISDRDPALPSLWQSEANQQKMIALWKKLAERYSNETFIGAYDIINEPNWGFESANDKNGCAEKTNVPLRKLMMGITEAIRAVDKNHMIIVEGNCWGNNYNGVFPLWDNNTAISFHKYWNYNDKASIQKALDIRETQSAPIWLGESGENSNVWFRDAIHLMESNEIGWAWWPLKKLGGNNPMEVAVPDSWQHVLDYWQGKKDKPTVDETKVAMADLAKNLKSENNIIHRDVIDAMFRQIHSKETLPFKHHGMNTEIAATEYDLGRNGYAYYDLDSGNYYISTGKEHTVGNSGGAFRNDAVDIYKDHDGGYYIGHVEAGEWLQYTINTEREMTPSLKLRFASTEKTNLVQLKINGTLLDAVTLADTGDKWNTVLLKGLTLRKGHNTIRVISLNGGIKIKSIVVVN